ncbi:MAG: histidinol dehydrogenase, partial [Gammaproteobacteria bacterium]
APVMSAVLSAPCDNEAPMDRPLRIRYLLVVPILLGALVLVASLEDAVDLANRLAPEHLELLVGVPATLLPRVRHAGAVFLGGQTPEVVGDYVAGPSHVLPTAGTARFSSPLGVEDFVKRTSVIEYSRPGLAAARAHLAALADVEGLAGHGRAAEVRLNARHGGEGR